MITDKIRKNVEYSFAWTEPTNDPMASSSVRLLATATMEAKGHRFHLKLKDANQSISFTPEKWRELNQLVETLIQEATL